MLASHLISTGSICLSIYIYIYYIYIANAMLLVSTFFQTAKYYIVGVLLVTYPIRSHCIKKIFINCLVLRILNPTICTHYGFNIYIYMCVLISIIQLCWL